MNCLLCNFTRKKRKDQCETATTDHGPMKSLNVRILASVSVTGT